MGFFGALGRLISVLLLLAGAGFVVGWFLPSEHSIRKTSVFAAPPAQVFAAVTDLEGQRKWRSDLRSLSVESSKSPLRWTEEADGYRLRFQEVTSDPPKTIEVEFESAWGVRGRLKLDFTGTGERTELSSVETIVLDNPYLRLSKLLFINFDSYLDRYLTDLGVRVSTTSASDPATATSATATVSGGTATATGTAAPTAAPPTATASATAVPR